MIISRNPPIVAISVSPKRHSHDLIEAAKEFTLNIPTKQNIKEVYYCGTHSGRTVDKFAETNLTSLNGININCPRIKESIGHIECKVIDSKQYGDHTLFVGEVVTCLWKKDISQKTALEEIEIPYHLGGNKFVYNKNKIEKV
jgi:flavin reductase (DIM6/NTAB) family NADH-FMN oxidoreductase RutF